jgi:hypothetical protein
VRRFAGAQPVCIRHCRLAPLEKELLSQVDAFIQKGWIEPSTNARPTATVNSCQKRTWSGIESWLVKFFLPDFGFLGLEAV